jgi:hypothetical protein
MSCSFTIAQLNDVQALHPKSISGMKYKSVVQC